MAPGAEACGCFLPSPGGITIRQLCQNMTVCPLPAPRAPRPPPAPPPPDLSHRNADARQLIPIDTYCFVILNRVTEGKLHATHDLFRIDI